MIARVSLFFFDKSSDYVSMTSNDVSRMSCGRGRDERDDADLARWDRLSMSSGPSSGFTRLLQPWDEIIELVISVFLVGSRQWDWGWVERVI